MSIVCRIHFHKISDESFPPYRDRQSARQLVCDAGYEASVPGDLKAICADGSWEVVSETGQDSQACLPSCEPACLNMGNCTAPNTCSCSSKFFGPVCQFQSCSSEFSLIHGIVEAR